MVRRKHESGVKTDSRVAGCKIKHFSSFEGKIGPNIIYFLHAPIW